MEIRYKALLKFLLKHDVALKDIEIIDLVMCGLDNREIGAHFGHHHRTICNRVTYVYKYLGFTSRAGFIAFCREYLDSNIQELPIGKQNQRLK